MSRFFDLVAKPVRNMGGYSPGMPLRLVAPQVQQKLIKLDSNENPFGPSPRAVEAMRRALAISLGDPLVLLQSPMSATLLGIALVALLAPFVLKGLGRFRASED